MDFDAAYNVMRFYNETHFKIQDFKAGFSKIILFPWAKL